MAELLGRERLFLADGLKASGQDLPFGFGSPGIRIPSQRLPPHSAKLMDAGMEKQ